MYVMAEMLADMIDVLLTVMTLKYDLNPKIQMMYGACVPNMNFVG